MNGLQTLLDTGIQPTVYVSAAFPAFKPQGSARTRLVEVTDALKIFPGVHTTRLIGYNRASPGSGDKEWDGVITGCAHPGIAKMVRQAQEVVPGKISLLAGGYHLLEMPDKVKMPSIIAEVRALGVERILPAHCTGDEATALFRTEYGENCIEGGVGRTVASSAK